MLKISTSLRIEAAAPGEAAFSRWKLMLVALVPSALTLCTGIRITRVRVSCCTSYTTAHQPPAAAATPASSPAATVRSALSATLVSFSMLSPVRLTLSELVAVPAPGSRDRCPPQRPSLNTKYRLVMPSHCS